MDPSICTTARSLLSAVVKGDPAPAMETPTTTAAAAAASDENEDASCTSLLLTNQVSAASPDPLLTLPPSSPHPHPPLQDQNQNQNQKNEQQNHPSFVPPPSSPALDAILDDDDDFELTFSLDVKQRAAAEALARSRHALRSEEYRQLFRLPPDEVLIQDFNCALQKKILLQGHMYLFEHYVCFYSNIFGYEKKKVIILKDVTSVRKAKTAGLFPNAIEIEAWGKKSFFASFLSRDEAYRLIQERWARHSKNAVLDSDSQNNLLVLISHPVQTSSEQHDVPFSESSSGSSGIVEATSERITEAIENVAEVSNKEVMIEEALPSKEDSSSSDEAKDEQITDDEVSKQNSFWQIEDEDAPTVGESYKTVLECELPVGVEAFFKMFFSNESLKFFESFHQKCGDQDFRCTTWAKGQHFGGHVRDVSFRHPVKVYFGPKASNCQEVQRYRVYRNSHLVVETSQQMNDIPYGDYFHVEGHWDVVPLIGKETPSCAVRVFVNVSFSKRTVWKGKIEQGTFDECREVYGTWLSEAYRCLEEKGLIESKPMKVDNVSQTIVTGSSKPKTKVKRKLEVANGQIQGQGKVSRTSLSRQASQEAKQMLVTLPSPAINESEKLEKHEDFVARLGFGDPKKLLVIICILTVLLLIQTGIIITLSSLSKVQYVQVGTQKRAMVHYEPLSGDASRPDSSWLQESARLLEEEIRIAEARIENLQHSVSVLKNNFKLIEKSVYNSGVASEVS